MATHRAWRVNCALTSYLQSAANANSARVEKPTCAAQVCDYTICVIFKSTKTVLVRSTQGKGLMPDSSSRFRCKGQMIHHFVSIYLHLPIGLDEHSRQCRWAPRHFHNTRSSPMCLWLQLARALLLRRFAFSVAALLPLGVLWLSSQESVCFVNDRGLTCCSCNSQRALRLPSLAVVQSVSALLLRPLL